MLARVQQLARADGYTNARLLQADARQLPYRRQVFDVLYSSYMLDSLPIANVRATLAEFRRALEPGARMVLVNMSKASPDSRTWVERLYQTLPAAWVPIFWEGAVPCCWRTWFSTPASVTSRESTWRPLCPRKSSPPAPESGLSHDAIRLARSRR